MNINKQVTPKECFATICIDRRSLVYCLYIVCFTLLRARASPRELTRRSFCALTRLQGTWQIESPRRWKSRESILFPGNVPYESDEGSCCTFFGGGGVLRCFNPIWTYSVIDIGISRTQGGRSWKASFSTVARVASRRNDVHCYVYQDTHSYPLHTLQKKRKEMTVWLGH